MNAVKNKKVAQAIKKIRQNRKGVTLGKDLTVKKLKTEGRR